MMKNARFFTLIEILVTFAIIAILSLIGYGSYSYATNSVKTARSEALLKNLQSGLESFYNNHSYYPQSAADGKLNAVVVTLGTDNTVYKINFGVTELEDSPSDPVKKKQFNSFAKAVDLETLKQNRDSSGRLTDAWGVVIYYRAPGAINTTSFDLIAPGEDGGFGSGKVAAPPETPVVTGESGRTYIDKDNDWICDDIANF